MRKQVPVLILFLLSGFKASHPQTADQADLAYRSQRDNLYRWEDWQFALGSWKGGGRGVAGEGPGKVTFRTDLDGKVLVFTNEQQFGAKADRPAFTYRSIIYVYLYGLKPRADFFDNEGHFLNFDIATTKSPHQIIFKSTETGASLPRFRFTFTQKSVNELAMSFDIAPASTPTKFSSYVSGVVQRTDENPK